MKNTKKPVAKKINKSAWIRALPASVSAKDAVKLAKKDGIKLTAAQVYTARSQASVKTRRTSSVKNLSDLQRQFVALAVRIGTDDAQRLLNVAIRGEFASPKPLTAKPIAKVVQNGLAHAVEA